MNWGPALWCLVYFLPGNITTLKAFQTATACDYSPRSNVLAVSVSWLASVLWQLGAIRGNDSLFVLTLRSNYLFSQERFWGKNDPPSPITTALARSTLMMAVFVVFVLAGTTRARQSTWSPKTTPRSAVSSAPWGPTRSLFPSFRDTKPPPDWYRSVGHLVPCCT